MDFFKKFNKLNLKDKDGKRRFISLVVTVFGIFLIVTGTSVAYLMGQYVGGENTITAGTLVLYLPTESNGISLNGAVPKTDALGLNQTEKYTFTLKNNGTIDMKYSIMLKNDCKVNESININGSSIIPDVCVPNEYVKVGIKKGNDEAIIKKLSNDALLEGTLSTNEQINFEIKLWLDESTPNDYQGIVNGVERNVIFYGTVALKGEQVIPRLLTELVLGTDNSNILLNTPTLNNEYSIAGDPVGLYVSTDTNNGNPTYYYRGNVSNNYVNFANMMWRIVRINEDGTIRLLLQDGINNNEDNSFNPNKDNYTYMYYSNSDVEGGIKRTVDAWYDNNIKGYQNYIADTEFCEQYKVSYNGGCNVGNEIQVVYNNYNVNFKCNTDKNGKGVIMSKVGLLTYDEAVHAGAYPGKNSNSYIINSNYRYWLMSPSGRCTASYKLVWFAGTKLDTYSGSSGGGGYGGSSQTSITVKPVISLKKNVIATGIGTSQKPYVIKTN